MKGRDTLDVFDFGVLFQALAQSLKVGTLRVSSGTREKFIYLNRGRVEAIYTPRSKFRLGRILYNLRVILMDDLRPVLLEQQKEDVTQPLGEMLLSRGLITDEELRTAVRYQMVEELLEVFYWKSVSYSFFSGPPEKALHQISSGLTRVGGSLDSNDLLLHVTKIIDDIDKFNEVTPSLKDVYELTEDPEEYVARSGLPAYVTDFLMLIDGKRDMREILREMRLNRFEVMELFYRFRTEGLIRAKNGFELLMLAENQKKDFTLQKVARLYERVRELGVEGFEVCLRMAQVYEGLRDTDRAAAHYLEYAKKSLREGDLEAAEHGASRAVEVYPNSRSLRNLCVTILEKCGKKDKMVDELSVLAQLHLEKGENAEAEVALARALEIRPQDEELALRRVDALGGLGRSREAGKVCVALALAREEARDYQGAQEALRLAISVAPDVLSFRNVLIRHLMRHEDKSGAISELGAYIPIAARLLDGKAEQHIRVLRAVRKRLEDLGGQNSTAMAVLADAFLAIGDQESGLGVLVEAGDAQTAARRLTTALETFSRAVEIAPEDDVLRGKLARVHADLGEPEKALAQYRRIAAHHRKRGDMESTERAYRDMLRVSPFSPEALQELANITAQQGKKAEAAKRMAQIGVLHQTAGCTEDAIEFFDEACVLDPGNPIYVRQLAESLGEVLQIERSLASFGDLLNLHRSRGEHAGAIDAALRILEVDAGRPAVLKALRDSYEALGESICEAMEKSA